MSCQAGKRPFDRLIMTACGKPRSEQDMGRYEFTTCQVKSLRDACPSVIDQDAPNGPFQFIERQGTKAYMGMLRDDRFIVKVVETVE